jgi:hypothetical protein
MQTARMTAYECRKCGTKVVVTGTDSTNLQPIYCCGMEVAEVEAVRRQLGAKALKSAKKEKGEHEKAIPKAARKKTAARTSPKKKAPKNTKKK